MFASQNAEDAVIPTVLQAFGPRPGLPAAILALMYFHCPNLCGVVQDDLLHALDLSGLKTPADYRLIAINLNCVSIGPDRLVKTTASAASLDVNSTAHTPSFSRMRSMRCGRPENDINP